MSHEIERKSASSAGGAAPVRYKLKQANRIGKPRLSVFRSASTSMRRSSTIWTGPHGGDSASSLEKDRARQVEVRRGTSEAAAEVGKLIAERAIKAGRQVGRVRSRRISLSRPDQGAGRRRA